jgi:tetratricopeptide (TPR) repeat protein
MENNSEILMHLLDDALATFPVDESAQVGEQYRLLAAQPGLHRESMALLGICAALECDNLLPHAQIERAAHWLDIAIESGWLNADAALENVHFPTRILAWRALTFADRRRTLLAQTQLSSSRAIEQLASIEVALECGSTTQEQLTQLTSIDVEDCLPLPASMALLWRTWLQAEHTWWLGGNLSAFLPALEDAIHQRDDLNKDPLIQAEAQRLKHRAALFLARYALSLGDAENTRGCLDVASGFLPDHWETHYMSGMLAWHLGDTKQARLHLENSLTANPFQQRPRFELDLLLCSRADCDRLPQMPGPHDALVGLAMQLFQAGRLDEARESLESLDQAEGPFSIRLIWPQAHLARVQQAWRLRAHLAEAVHDLEGALKFWKIARQLPLQGAARLTDDERAHHLYLLGRTLGNIRQSSEDLAKREVYMEFRRELGMLSSRDPLNDGALFYVGLAAEEPGHGVSDWPRLLRTNEWVERTLQQSPQNLICLGDRLWRAGQLRDAWKSYVKARCGTLDPTRWLYISLALANAPTPRTMLDLLSPDKANSIPPGRGDLLRALCLLAEQPANREEVQLILEKSGAEGLPLEMEEMVENLLIALQSRTFQPRARAESESPRWLSMLETGLELLFSSRGLKSLSAFRSQYGTAWLEWCPVDLMRWFGQELQSAIHQQDAQLAETILSTALDLGIQLPPSWKARAYLLGAIVKARQHELAAAAQALRFALSSLPPETT